MSGPLDELRERLRGLFDEYGWADYTPWEVFADTLDAFAAAHDLVDVVRCDDCAYRGPNCTCAICTEETYKAALVYAQRGDKQALRNLVKDYTGACSLDGVELPMVDWDEIIAIYMEE